MKLHWLAILVAVVLSGCAHPPLQPEWKLGRYSFGYQVEHPEDVGLVQVFDDGASTYLQFSNLNLARECIQVRTAKGKRLSVTIAGGYLLIKGMHPMIELNARTIKRCKQLGPTKTARTRVVVKRMQILG